MAELVPQPVLDIRDEELLAAEAIARVAELCEELTNANASSPHTVLIETFTILVAFVTRAINQVPEQNKIEFARLFKIELREAAAATATLSFTTAAPAGVAVIIPPGTEVRAADGSVFITDLELVIPAGEMTGTVAATRNETGATLLAPNTVTQLVNPIAYISDVTNPDAIESGSEAETVESALERARSYQRRGERIVNAQDLQEAIFDDVLFGNGVVKVFDKIKDSDWLNIDGSIKTIAGHVTVVVMTRTGHAFSASVKEQIRLKAKEWVGGIFIYVKDPEFVDFNVEADVRLDGLITQSATLAAIEKNLRDFYSAKEENFGRTISRSEIIAVVEGTKGVRRIEPQPGGEILAEPAEDADIAPYELPRLVTVTINVV